MRLLKYLVAFAALAFTGALAALPASAQATRTWVSGVGDDANPCSRTAPCKTFAGAISKTATGGEINCIDPGGFGAVTITKSMAIICDEVEAGVLVSSGPGVTINISTAGGVVYLSGLDFEGLNAGTNGINIVNADTVTVRNSQIRGFATAGINVALSTGGVHLDVLNTTIADNPGTGILLKPSGSGSIRGTLDNTQVSHSGVDGVFANANLTTGSIKIAVRDSQSTRNAGNGFAVFSGGRPAQIVIDSSTASNNNVGLAATGSGAAISFTHSTVTANATGVIQNAPGTVTSYVTNVVSGNGTDGTFTTASQN